MPDTDKEPSSSIIQTSQGKPAESPNHHGGVVVWLKNLIKAKPESDESLREVLEDYIEEMSSHSDNQESSVSHELKLLSNILELRDMTAEDVMIPRVDIVAVDISIPPDEFLDILSKKQH
ncbi:MAG: hypothetical protein KDJ26_05930, partial [Alphaproteobacteria bacterium]|nr:hypothetical protein [Alphaproteobacteria bacterium]